MKKLVLCLCATIALFAPFVQAQFTIDARKVCPEVQDRLGQLLYINVDGYGDGVKQAIHPAYINLVKLLNIGGVMPQFGKTDITLMQQSVAQLASATNLPLFIGGQHFKLEHSGAFGEQSQKVGFSQGQCANHSSKNQLELIDAFLFKTVGFNHWLGPRVAAQLTPAQQQAQARFKYMSLFNTAHFPWQTVDSSRPILQTRHLLDKQYKQMMTISRPWLRAIGDDTDFSGLILSDALVEAKTDNGYVEYVQDWLVRHPNDDPKAVFAAKALMAGHNMVMLKGVARDTLKVYEGLGQIACRNDSDGTRLLYAIEESFHKISKFKRSNRGALSYRPKVEEKLIQDALDYKYRLTANSCKMPDKTEFSSLQQRILML